MGRKVTVSDCGPTIFWSPKTNSKKKSTKFQKKNPPKKIPTVYSGEKFSKGLGTISIEIRSELDKTVVTSGHRQALA